MTKDPATPPPKTLLYEPAKETLNPRKLLLWYHYCL